MQDNGKDSRPNEVANALRGQEDAAFWRLALQELERAAAGKRMNAAIAVALADRIRKGMDGYMPISWMRWWFTPGRDESGRWSGWGRPPGFTDGCAVPIEIRAVAYALGCERFGIKDRYAQRMKKLLKKSEPQWQRYRSKYRDSARAFLDVRLCGAKAFHNDFAQCVGQPDAWRALLHDLDLSEAESII